MLTIRLARVGRKKRPSYRLIVSENARDTFGRSIEIVGHYHPLKDGSTEKIVLNEERIKHWLSQGAQTSNTVHNLLVDEKIIEKDKKRTIFNTKKKKESTSASTEKGAPATEEKPAPDSSSEESQADKKDSPEQSSPASEDSSGKSSKAEKKEETKTEEKKTDEKST